MLTQEDKQQIEQIIADKLSGFIKIDRYVFDKNIQILDGRNIQVGRTIGTKIGTATDQKIEILANSGTKIRAYRATSVQAITTDTWTKVQLNAETFDINSEFDIATNYRFTATKAGYYLVSGALKYQSVAAKLPFHIAFYKNGTVYSQIRTFSATDAGDDEGIGLSDVIYLAVGGYVELYTWHYMGGPTKNIMNGSDITFLAIIKLA